MSEYASLRRKRAKTGITLDEWLAVVRGDPQLSLQANGKDVTFTDPEEPDDPRALVWSERAITTKAPNDAVLEKLKEIADKLYACVIEIEGVDEVYYESEKWKPPVREPRGPFPYSTKTKFEEGDLVDHPKFGRGKVTKVAGKTIVVSFDDGREAKLAHGL